MKQAKVYVSNTFAGILTEDDMGYEFFDGLIPEGWLLNIAEQSWKISARDRFSLLLACCKDCIGNVSITPMEDKEI